MLLLVAFEGTEVAAMGGEEEGHGQCWRALPDLIVSVPTLPSLALEGASLFPSS